MGGRAGSRFSFRRADLKVNLIRFKPDGEQRHFHMKGETCLIGRQDECDLTIPASAVSREHCRLQIRDGSLYVSDSGSRNGTFVNEEQVEGEQEVQAGDRLAVGPFVFTVQIDGEPEEVEPPLLDAPVKRKAKQSASGQGASSSDDSEAEIADLIAELESDDSSVFDVDALISDDDDDSDDKSD